MGLAGQMGTWRPSSGLFVVTVGGPNGLCVLSQKVTDAQRVGQVCGNILRSHICEIMCSIQKFVININKLSSFTSKQRYISEGLNIVS